MYEYSYTAPNGTTYRLHRAYEEIERYELEIDSYFKGLSYEYFDTLEEGLKRLDEIAKMEVY